MPKLAELPPIDRDRLIDSLPRLEGLQRKLEPQEAMQRFVYISSRLACFIAMVGIMGLWLSGAQPRAAEAPSPGYPRITYTKVLPGSFPEFVSLIMDEKGIASYEGRRVEESTLPRPIRLSETTARRVFELAHGLNNFDHIDLESHKKVANLGRKTLIYDDGERKHQTEFNFTTRREAEDLVDLLEKIAAAAQHVITLEYSIQFDRLRLPEQLRQIQKDLDRRALAEVELMEPTLRKIAKDPRLLHLAQSRAQNILERLQTRN